MSQMDERKSQVLRAIIQDYITTAEPVGSRTLARRYRLGVSPATIRNEMADLEELGYLEQPHTSAGRVPSSRGYRYYVDCLMEAKDVSPEDEATIEMAFKRRIGEIDTLIQQTARVLAETTSYPSMVLGPQFQRPHFHQLHLVPISEDRALLVLVTDEGIVENEIIEMPVEITMLDVQRFVRSVSEKLRGQPLHELNPTAVRELQQDLYRYRALLGQTLDFVTRTGEEVDQERVYLGGTTKIMGQPEFRDVQKVKMLFEVLEQERVVHDILSRSSGHSDERVDIQIGEEIQIHELRDCSVISATYRVGDQTVGRLGVLGPRRMEYAKVAAIVEDVSRRLSDSFQRT